MDQLNSNREQWGSRLGFILAAMGSAVGLGNIWRFSYVTGENGGAAFLLVYLLCIIAIGIPIIMAEFTIGRKAQSDAVGSFEKLAPGKPWILAGFMGVASAFIILSFYGVIAGWTVKYFFSYLTGGFSVQNDEAYADVFVGFITSTYEPLFWQFAFMAITVGIVFVGVKKGIEATNKILMPLLAILVVILAGYSLSLGGASEALSFLFTPDWSKLADPNVYLAALGQAFFSLSLGMGALITYGSYLSKKEQLPGAALGVAALDTGFAIIAGLMIFPAVFAFGIEPGFGPGLVFITLPGIFDSIAFGTLFGLAFFFLLAAAALSSAVSLLEVAVAYFIRKFSWSRQKASLIVGGIIFLLGIPSSLGIGPLSDITFFGKDILDSMDFIASNILLPLGGLIIALFMGWGWKKTDALAESDFGDTAIGHAWIFTLRYFAPIAIFLIFLASTGLLDLIKSLFS
ncbi:sodium-dependent transporter [Anaerobacillus isosaccharinicus]|uniref:Sodium-dependent transporter n=1 Tax=Anaerobacillus isosaccharinicus TaxID=1532552 RepID=A0A1S2M610_9BACI|nr:sodium-dependent transporter [Anaerobacillus isosaccharinicus]MBA5588199.1 sodium-dependent transporter [Anaerobacillus isosaccharinicus]QOY38352.1 sodium-dependent transporter [Anaerobacillus isosaccharinicus]